MGASIHDVDSYLRFFEHRHLSTIIDSFIINIYLIMDFWLTPLPYLVYDDYGCPHVERREVNGVSFRNYVVCSSGFRGLSTYYIRDGAGTFKNNVDYS